jgi:hypothetical protein
VEIVAEGSTLYTLNIIESTPIVLLTESTGSKLSRICDRREVIENLSSSKHRVKSSNVGGAGWLAYSVGWYIDA